MLTLIKNCQVYAPAPLGTQDIFIAGERIVAIAPNIPPPPSHCRIVDAQGLIAHPGLVDSLVHISGGGGEGGFHTRTPQMELTEASLAGVTTVVGALGTDATTRSLPDLVAKARALNTEGLSAYCYTGSYQLPARTITGSITDDIALIDSMIGVGEVAIADHRGAQPDYRTLAQAASEANVGGMLAGKGGITYIHVGDAPEQLRLLHEVVEHTPVRANQFYPTHMNRNLALVQAGIEWTKLGGVIDMTTSTNEHFIAEGEVPAAQAIAYCIAQGVSPKQLSMSSDGNASLPVFDANGTLIGLEVGRVKSLHTSLVELVSKYEVDLEHALTTVTTTPANYLKLNAKGALTNGADADIVLADPNTLTPQHVFARGQQLVAQGQPTRKGTFA